MAMPTDSALPMALPVHEEERVQEASLHASLGRLQEMHVAVSSSSIVSQSLKGQFVNSTASKLRRLRDTIPHVVTSIQLATSTLEPAEFYAQFAYAATAAGKDIKEFMHMMSDNRAKEIFEQINKSREADGEGIDGWRVTEHEDWLDIKKVPKDEVDSDEDMEGQGNPIKVEGREKVVAAFRAAHPDIEVLLRDLVTVSKLAQVLLLFLNNYRLNYLHRSISTFLQLVQTKRLATRSWELLPQIASLRPPGRFPELLTQP